MKVMRITSSAALSLLFAIAAPAYAQQEQHGEKQDHPKQQQSKHEQTKPESQHAQPRRQTAPRQHPAQHAQQQQGQSRHNQPERAQQPSDRPRGQTQHAQQEQRHEQHGQQAHAQPQRGNDRSRHAEEQQRVQRSAWQGHRSQNWQSDHRNWQQRGGYRGYRVPEYRFNGYFGREHEFRIHGLPFLVVGGYPRFQYHGYWLSAVDPWPESWADNWYDTDDVYVTRADTGYYLYNRRYPDVGLAISISR
jgi:hypothetical protein